MKRLAEVTTLPFQRYSMKLVTSFSATAPYSTKLEAPHQHGKRMQSGKQMNSQLVSHAE